jgi:penicillin amidase
VAGATLPGVPVVWTGFNSRVAWASTASAAVVADLFEETLHAEDPSRYADGNTWRKLQSRPYEILRRDGAPEQGIVRSTARGPLVNGFLPGVDRPLSLRWAGALPGGGLEGLLRVARARDASQLLAALALHREPALVVAYADAAGTGCAARQRRAAAAATGLSRCRRATPPSSG